MKLSLSCFGSLSVRFIMLSVFLNLRTNAFAIGKTIISTHVVDTGQGMTSTEGSREVTSLYNQTSNMLEKGTMKPNASYPLSNTTELNIPNNAGNATVPDVANHFTDLVLNNNQSYGNVDEEFNKTFRVIKTTNVDNFEESSKTSASLKSTIPDTSFNTVITLENNPYETTVVLSTPSFGEMTTYEASTNHILTDETTEVNNEASYSTATVTQNDDSSALAPSTTDNLIINIEPLNTQQHINIKTTKTPFFSESLSETTPISDANFTRETTIQDTSTINLPREIFNETIKPLSTIKDLPSWKKYTTIERKYNKTQPIKNTTPTINEVKLTISQLSDSASPPTSSSISTETLQEVVERPITKLVSAETKRTGGSWYIPKDIPTKSEPSAHDQITMPTESVTETDTTKSSLRGGYLDNSIKFPDNETVNEALNQYNESTNTNATEPDPSVKHHVENNLMESKKTPIAVSQSQLSEDAIKEELLIEETLSDNEENAKRHRDEYDNAKNDSNSSYEEKLSVKPISNKGSSIYAVNPNYKPLKKLDIVPPKSFVRDPDDNSWRNESISSLGIVFKANNSSKPLTQVLKNKTESELKRLETEKSKKGIDSDEATYEPTDTVTEPVVTTTSTDSTVTITEVNLITITPLAKPRKPTKQQQFKDYFYNIEDEGADYITLPNIDIKKSIVTQKQFTTTPSVPTTDVTKLTSRYLSDRKPTVQYFPPLPSTKFIEKYIGDAAEFDAKLNKYTIRDNSKTTLPMILTQTTTASSDLSPYNFNRNFYNTFTSSIPSAPSASLSNEYITEGNTNVAPYVINHFKDIIKASENEGNLEYIPNYFNVANDQQKTHNIATDTKLKSNNEFDKNFSKDVLDKFIENYNENTKRFNVNYPVVFNNSIIHSKAEEGGRVLASSVAFMKQAYHSDATTTRSSFLEQKKPCDPNCDRVVELSPEYELHYYIPEQEEKDVAEQRTFAIPL